MREIVPLGRIPSSDAVGDGLCNMGVSGGLYGLAKVNRLFLNRDMKYDGITGYTLDIDVTRISAEKPSAKMTYKGFKEYMPMVGHTAENGLMVGDELREGNVSPATRNLAFITDCVRQMPKGTKIKRLRSHSAAYQAEIITCCDHDGIHFAIGADLDEAVFKAIKTIPDNDGKPYKNGYLAETIHSMEKTEEAFRLIFGRVGLDHFLALL